MSDLEKALAPVEFAFAGSEQNNESKISEEAAFTLFVELGLTTDKIGRLIANLQPQSPATEIYPQDRVLIRNNILLMIDSGKKNMKKLDPPFLDEVIDKMATAVHAWNKINWRPSHARGFTELDRRIGRPDILIAGFLLSDPSKNFTHTNLAVLTGYSLSIIRGSLSRVKKLLDLVKHPWNVRKSEKSD